MTVVGVLLVGGDSTSSSFRPLSFGLPPPLVPIAGVPLLEHHVRALSKVPGLTHLYICGFYQGDAFPAFARSMEHTFGSLSISYLSETRGTGTAGSLAAFSDEILSSRPTEVFVLAGDVVGDFELEKMLEFHRANGKAATVLGKRVPKEKAHGFGQLVLSDKPPLVAHFVEKPGTFLSDLANCGVYCLSASSLSLVKAKAEEMRRSVTTQGSASGDPIPSYLSRVSHTTAGTHPHTSSHSSASSSLPTSFSCNLERHVVPSWCASGELIAFEISGKWTQIKTAAMLLHACGLLLEEREGKIAADKSAKIDPTAKVGPNVAVGPGVVIGPGCRVSNSILLKGCVLQANSFVTNSVLGDNCVVGAWARVEGLLDNDSFHRDDHMKPGNIVVMGRGVTVSSEVIVRGSIVCPEKEVSSSSSNEIIL